MEAFEDAKHVRLQRPPLAQVRTVGVAPSFSCHQQLTLVVAWQGGSRRPTRIPGARLVSPTHSSEKRTRAWTGGPEPAGAGDGGRRPHAASGASSGSIDGWISGDDEVEAADEAEEVPGMAWTPIVAAVADSIPARGDRVVGVSGERSQGPVLSLPPRRGRPGSASQANGDGGARGIAEPGGAPAWS